MKSRITFHELVFISILSTALGIMWGGYSFIYSILLPILRPFALNGLMEGIWQIAGVFFAVIIRKPGSALLGSFIAAAVEGLISQWGIPVLLSGLLEGLAAELVFFGARYRKFDYMICILAATCSSVGGYVVTYFWYGYANFSLTINLINFIMSLFSSAILGGILARILAFKLAKTGVLNQFLIIHDQSFNNEQKSNLTKST